MTTQKTRENKKGKGRVIIVGLLIGLTLVAALLTFFLSTIVKIKLEAVLNDRLGHPQRIASLHIGLFPRPLVVIRGIELHLNNSQTADVPSNVQIILPEIRLGTAKSLWELAMTKDLVEILFDVDSPQIQITQLTLQKSNDSNSSQILTAAKDDQGEQSFLLPDLSKTRDISLTLHIQNGNITYRKPTESPSDLPLVQVSNLDLRFLIPQLKMYSAQLQFSGESSVNFPQFQIKGPTQFNIEVGLANNELTVSKASGELFHLNLALQGRQNIQTHAGNWDLRLSAPDLSQMPKLPSFLPQGEWSGKIFAGITAQSHSITSGWNTHFVLRGDELSGSLNVENNQLAAKGKIRSTFNLSGSTSIDENNPEQSVDALKVESLKLFADLTQLNIKKNDLFFKPANIPLKVELDGSGSKAQVFLKKFAMQFANLMSSANGLYMEKAASRIEFNIQKTNLSGWEKFFPSLLSTNKLAFIPSSTSVELQGTISGQMNQLNSPLFNISNLTINTKKNSLTAKGSISGISTPQINLAIFTHLNDFAEILNLGGIHETLPIEIQANKEGLTANTLIQGKYDRKNGLTNSPLIIKTIVSTDIGSLHLTRKKSAKKNSDLPSSNSQMESPSNAPPTGALPNWPLFQSAQADLAVKIGTFNFIDKNKDASKLNINGLKTNFRYRNGNIEFNGGADQIFGGKVQVSNLKANLHQANTNINFSSTTNNINLEQATNWASEEWRGLVRGFLNSRLSVDCLNCSKLNFIDKIKANGSIEIKNGFLSTIQLDQIINEKLSQIPALSKGNRLNSKGVAAQITSTLKLQMPNVYLDQFHFLTPENNELEASGRIGLDKSIELEGKAHLATTSIGGSIRAANSDSQGRFVIPIKIQGNLLKPEAKIAQDAVEKILQNTANYEVNKAKEKVKATIEKEGQKLKDELEKNGKKQLEDLKKRLGF